MLALSAPVEALPLVALAPLQPPDAVHEVALVALQVRFEALPLDTLVGFAASVTVGSGGVTGVVPVPVTGAVADEQAASTSAARRPVPAILLPDAPKARRIIVPCDAKLRGSAEKPCFVMLPRFLPILTEALGKPMTQCRQSRRLRTASLAACTASTV